MRSLYDPIHTQPSADQRVARFAARQYGVFTRKQAIECGATPAIVRWRLRVGRWERVFPNVYRLAGATKTWRQLAMAACLYLGPEAALSHRAAAFAQKLRRRSDVEVSMHKNRNRVRSDSIIIHWTKDPIPEEDIMTIDGIRVTKPARTLLDLATVEDVEVLERAFDDALRRRLISLPFLERWLADPCRRNHRGAPSIRRLIEERATTGVTTARWRRSCWR